MFTNDDMDDNERKTFSRQFRKNKVSVFDEGTAAKLSAHLDLPEGDFLLKKYLTNITQSNRISLLNGFFFCFIFMEILFPPMI